MRGALRLQPSRLSTGMESAYIKEPTPERTLFDVRYGDGSRSNVRHPSGAPRPPGRQADLSRSAMVAQPLLLTVEIRLLRMPGTPIIRGPRPG